MEQYTGGSVVKEIAIGSIYVFEKKESSSERKTIENPDQEVARFQAARTEAMEQLDKLYQEALAQVGEEEAMIFDTHKVMLEDLDYLEAIEEKIRTDRVNAEYAVTATGEEFAAIFAGMDDEYMQARAADVKDISDRVVRILEGRQDAGFHPDKPVIVLAQDLTPAETIQMDKSKILAFVTQKEAEQKELAGREDALKQLIGMPSETRDGRKIKIYANMGNVEDVAQVLKNDAEGIGLFRSEFLYLGREDFPGEEEQFEAYKEVVSGMQGKKVIIRTLDIGADKKADYFGLDQEENPAMGYRAIRICLTREDIFRTQLRAIYRASAFGTVSIMFPMIISVDEIRKIKAIVEKVKAELVSEHIAMGEVELGIMIETPAAAVISDELAKEVDFFSIGTNDLTQYTLAIDRQNQKLDSFYDSHHEAVLRLIRMTVDNGHKAGIWVGICGELGADESLTEEFVNMGLDELSVSPSSVLKIRDRVRNIG